STESSRGTGQLPRMKTPTRTKDPVGDDEMSEHIAAQQVVKSERELREIYDRPSERAVCKETPTLGDDCRAFIAHSPFLVMGAAGADGTCDVAPEGDAPGFGYAPESQRR